MAYVRDNIEWFKRGALFKPAKNADETELEAMTTGVTPIEYGVQDDVVADEHHADLPEHQYRWQDEELALDLISGPVIQEIDRRIELGGDSYPFVRERGALRYVPRSTDVYEFCLVTSIQRDISSRPFNQLPITFELLTTELARCYLGNNAEGIRTGAPSHCHDARPVNFKRLMELVNERTLGEFQWIPTISINDDDDVNGPKDEGLDFIAWKPFGDLRLGQLFLLGQCACGDDWTEKFGDLDINRLERWINPVTWAKFIRAFSVPHHIPGHRIFGDVCRQAGITFDRLRLARVAEENAERINEHFAEKLRDGVRLLVGTYKV